MDTAAVLWLNRAARRGVSTRTMVAGAARWLSVVEIGLMLLLALDGRRGSALRMLAAVATVYVACDGLGRVWSRPRPFERVAGLDPLVEHSEGRSFPSRHVASGVAMAAIGSRAHPRLGAIMSLVACVLGASRVAAGVHYPTDILGGAALGLFVGCYARRS